MPLELIYLAYSLPLGEHFGLGDVRYAQRVLRCASSLGAALAMLVLAFQGMLVECFIGLGDLWLAHRFLRCASSLRAALAMLVVAFQRMPVGCLFRFFG